MSEELRRLLGACPPPALSPERLLKMAELAAHADRELQQRTARHLGEEVKWGADIAFAAPWLHALLGAEPEGRGAGRVDVARAAAECLRRMLRTPSGRRTQLEPLRALVAAGGTTGKNALRLLAAVAADTERWAELDELVAHGIAAVIDGMLDASEARVKEREHPDIEVTRQFVGAVIAHAEPLRVGLRKAERTAVEKRMEEQARRMKITTAGGPTPEALVARLFSSSASTRDSAWFDLRTILREDPSKVAVLPSIASVPTSGPKAEVAELHFSALRATGDLDAMRAHVAELRRLGIAPWRELSELQKNKDGARYHDVFLPLLDDPDPVTRWYTAHYLYQTILKQTPELADRAPILLRSILDTAKSTLVKEMVAVRSRPVLVAALAATTRRPEFIAAAQAIDAELEPERRKAFRTQLKALFPDALATLAKKPSAKPTPRRGLDSLLAAVHANLADDEPRLVYADALLESGDARGEHVILQCDRARTGGKPTARELALERMNGHAWAGPAGAWLAPTMRYERGFLVAAAHGGRGATIAPDAGADPVWTTLEELDMTKGPGEVDFLSHPGLRSLRRLTGLLASDLVRMTGRDLQHIALRRLDVAAALVIDALADHARLETLELGTIPEPIFLALAGARLPKLRTISFKNRRLDRDGKEWRESRRL